MVCPLQVEGKVGGAMEDTRLVEGIVIDKDFSHPQMPKELKDVKVAILTCPFEPPKPKTKHKVDIDTVEKFETLRQAEQQYFIDMVNKCKAAGKEELYSCLLPCSCCRSLKQRPSLLLSVRWKSYVLSMWS